MKETLLAEQIQRENETVESNTSKEEVLLTENQRSHVGPSD